MDRAQPRHPWHRDVRDDEIEGAVLRQMVDELGAVAGSNDVGSETREAFGHDVEQFRIVIRHEDARIERHRRRPEQATCRAAVSGGSLRAAIFRLRQQPCAVVNSGVALAATES